MTFERIGIVGAGTMGSGIAQVCASIGMCVTMVDVSVASAERGARAVAGRLGRPVQKGQLDDGERARVLARIAATEDYLVAGFGRLYY
jgi:3-hydroxybutyryl-CoA dehydrogenase